MRNSKCEYIFCTNQVLLKITKLVVVWYGTVLTVVRSSCYGCMCVNGTHVKTILNAHEHLITYKMSIFKNLNGQYVVGVVLYTQNTS